MTKVESKVLNIAIEWGAGKFEKSPKNRRKIRHFMKKHGVNEFQAVARMAKLGLID